MTDTQMQNVLDASSELQRLLPSLDQMGQRTYFEYVLEKLDAALLEEIPY